MDTKTFNHLNFLINQALINVDNFKGTIYYDAELANVYHKANSIEKQLISLREILDTYSIQS